MVIFVQLRKHHLTLRDDQTARSILPNKSITLQLCPQWHITDSWILFKYGATSLCDEPLAALPQGSNYETASREKGQSVKRQGSMKAAFKWDLGGWELNLCTPMSVIQICHKCVYTHCIVTPPPKLHVNTKMVAHEKSLYTCLSGTAIIPRTNVMNTGLVFWGVRAGPHFRQESQNWFSQWFS